MSDRLLNSVRRLVRALVGQVGRYGRWEYRVQSVTATPPIKVAAVPAGASPYGPISNIKLWPGPDGSVAVPAVGSLVLLAFNEGRGSKPCIVGLDPDVPPTMVYVGNSPGQPVARVGDHITITSAQILAATMVAGSNPVTITTPLQGTITSGSAKVQAT
jgi:hypothetical protein